MKVRQAIAYAINRTQVSQTSRLGLEPAGVGPVHYQTEWAFDPNLQPSYPYNVQKAKDLLDEAGFPAGTDGYRFTLSLNDVSGQPYNQDAEIIKDNLADVGIQIDHETMTTATANDLLFKQRQFELAIRYSQAGPDPTLALATMYSANTIGKGTYTNCMGYNNSQAEALLAQTQVESDPQTRKRLMTEWQSIIMTDLPTYTIIYASNFQAYREDWKGLPSNPWGSQGMFAENVWWTGGTSAIQGYPTGLIIGAAVAVVVVVLIVGLVLRRRRHRKR